MTDVSETPSSLPTIASRVSTDVTGNRLLTGTILQKLFKESWSAAAFTNLSGASATSVIDATIIKTFSTAYFRFAALWLKYHWHSGMKPAEWMVAANIYNDPATIVGQQYLTKPLAQDSVTRNGVTLKKHCSEFEGELHNWDAALKVGHGKSFSH